MIILALKIYNNFRREALELRTSEIFGITSELFEQSLDMIGSSRKYPENLRIYISHFWLKINWHVQDYPHLELRSYTTYLLYVHVC